MKFPLTLLALAAVFAASAIAAEVQKGEKAPVVTGTTETGAKLNFGDFYKKQKYTLVYFYPKADTPGCIAQGCSLRDSYEELGKKGVAVLGVSLDAEMDNKAFKEKYNLPFTLISDTEKTVVNAFGIPVSARNTAQREAFLIRDGIIVYANNRAPTDKQAEEVLAVIADLEKK